jgi:hypothetical protein
VAGLAPLTIIGDGLVPGMNAGGEAEDAVEATELARQLDAGAPILESGRAGLCLSADPRVDCCSRARVRIAVDINSVHCYNELANLWTKDSFSYPTSSLIRRASLKLWVVCQVLLAVCDAATTRGNRVPRVQVPYLQGNSTLTCRSQSRLTEKSSGVSL